MEFSHEDLISKTLISNELLVATCVVGIPPDMLEKFFSKKTIYKSIMNHKFAKHFKSGVIREILHSMYQKVFPKGSFIMEEKEIGQHIFVVETGKFKVKEYEKYEGFKGTVGELYGMEEFLMNTRKLRTIRAISKCKVWMLDRKIFKLIMKTVGPSECNLEVLRSFKLFKNANEDFFSRISGTIVIEYFGSHDVINMKSNTLYVISNGSVGHIRKETEGKEKIIGILTRGDHFHLQTESEHEYVAFYPGVELLLFEMQILQQLRKKNEYIEQKFTSIEYTTAEQEYCANIKLEDLKRVAILGQGNFGRVDLVRYTKDPMKPYALKQLEKYKTVKKYQQSLVINEREVLMSCKHPFIVRLYKTFRDERYVYMLFEACLGGPVKKILRKKGHFQEKTARFIVACATEALEYLHKKQIIYRDLKPDNIVIDQFGYVKLVDFGLSKQLGYTGRTWSFCGTTHNIAPEIILNVGYNRSVDYWALGLLTYELLCGSTLFPKMDPMLTYGEIIGGIENMDLNSQNISRFAENLVRKLCKREPTERLGYRRTDDIKRHRWFSGFNWNGLISRTITPPSCLIPTLIDSHDTSNFDLIQMEPYYRPMKEESDWDKVFE